MGFFFCQRNRGVCNRSVTLLVLPPPRGRAGRAAAAPGIAPRSPGALVRGLRAPAPRGYFLLGQKVPKKPLGDTPRPPLRGILSEIGGVRGPDANEAAGPLPAVRYSNSPADALLMGGLAARQPHRGLLPGDGDCPHGARRMDAKYALPEQRPASRRAAGGLPEG